MTKQPEHLIYGIRAVLETIASGKHLEKVYVQKGLKGDLITELREALSKHEVPSSVVPAEKLNRLTRKNHQGVAAFVSPIQYSPLDEIIAQEFEKGNQPLLVLLDGITDVRNFGSIARTAECMGASGIIIPSKGAAQVTADAVKTSAGALNFIPVCREPNIGLSVSYMKQAGIKVVACTEKTENAIGQLDLTGPLCIVMGAEDVGVSPEILATADERGKIPITGKIESLNVGSACSMALYEVSRQRTS
ncbi:MAG: 23S rRNA (guanosine(2251)-2'-O)-methyltransferase RlmB [Cyclobacteriaceae bacterium]